MLFLTSAVLAFLTFTEGTPLISLSQWTTLNQTVKGRLHGGVPLASPCYTNYNGTSQSINLGQCRTVQEGYKTGAYLVEEYSGFPNVNWATCQKFGQGCPLNYDFPLDPLTTLGKECYQGSVSPYYIEVQEVSDIQAAFAFAKQTKIPLSIKNSGHDYKGRSAAPGSLAIWTHKIQPAIKLTKDFIPDGCLKPVGDGVTFGAGQGFLELYKFAEANNITIVGGASPTVGAAGGWISGAGHSALSNTLGLGVDNVMQIRGVLPNGTYITANECQNRDLWFAWRGGGGSTFGVNFEMTTRANPQVQLQVAFVAFASLDPDSLSKFLAICIQNGNKWASEGWGGYIQPGAISQQSSGFVLITAKLTYAEAVASMKPIHDYVASLGNIALSNTVVTVNSYYEASSKYIIPFGWATGISTSLGSRLVPSYQLNGTANQTLLLNAINQIADIVTYPKRTWDPQVLTYGSPLQILVTAPSSFPTTAENDTSAITPAWRSAVWHVVFFDSFSNSASVEEIQKSFETTHHGTEILRKLMPNSGAYQNEADTFQTDAESTFWGSRYERLLSIKRNIDPENLLTCWDCIGWNSEDERFRCYPDVLRGQ